MRTLLAIPVYNEQRYVEAVLSEVHRYADDVLVIDDGSTDDTPLLLARQPVEVIRHAINRGYGRSMVDAFRWAMCYRYDWLITMDCDLQHEPASLPVFHEAIQLDDADVISGSRYMDSENDGDQPPADRRAINATMTAMVNDRLGLTITDAFCGFKAYRVSAVNKLSFDEAGYAFPLQFWVQAAAQGLASAQFNLGAMYYNGQGVSQNYVQAHMWFTLAVKHGYEEAAKTRDLVEKEMWFWNVRKAQRLAREWMAKHGK